MRAALRHPGRRSRRRDPGRRQKAQKDARVEAWTETAGTAALAGRDLGPAGALAADSNIDTWARWLKDHGSQGPLTALRAAVFLALLARLGQDADALPTVIRRRGVGMR